MSKISAESFLQLLDANINNDKLDDKGFRQMIRNTLPSINFDRRTQPCPCCADTDISHSHCICDGYGKITWEHAQKLK